MDLGPTSPVKVDSGLHGATGIGSDRASFAIRGPRGVDILELMVAEATAGSEGGLDDL
jgi:hypothetical protein